MATLKELKQKISSLRSTQKMTRTMKLVAASKMRRAQQAQVNAREYAASLRGMIANVAATAMVSHPLLEAHDPVRRSRLVVIASDRGLCGGFNNNLFRYAQHWVQEQASSLGDIDLSFCGRRGHLFFRSRFKVHKHYEGVTDRPNYESAARIADELMDGFTGGEVDVVYLMFNRFRTALSQVPTVERLLPVSGESAAAATSTVKSGSQAAAESGESSAAGANTLFEPAEAQLLDLLLPDAVRFTVFNALVENAAGEHAARMTAMDSATNNANDLIDRYTLQRNRERQAAITKELIEIVTGAESV